MAAVPIRDGIEGLDRCLRGGGRALVSVLAGLAAGWWVYVPLHELLHALGCVASGGEVNRLEIDAVYGGSLLAEVFPFVVPGSRYAGQLTGFDTQGSDLVYLATDLLPFALTLFPGVWILRRSARRGRAFAFGISLPLALAPFVSLTGDAYEIGSILVTRIPPWSRPETAALLRDDDLLERMAVLSELAGAPWGGWLLAAISGLVWALGTYLLASWIAARLGEPPLSSKAPLRRR